MEGDFSEVTPSASPTSLQRFSYWPLASDEHVAPADTGSPPPSYIVRRWTPLALIGSVLALLALILHRRTPCSILQLRASHSATDAGVVDWRTSVSDSVATVPVNRSDGWWLDRTNTISHNVQRFGPTAELLFIGDSITQRLETDVGAELWREHYVKLYGSINLGVSGDSTQHVIWRLQNGNLPSNIFNAHLLKCVVLLVGTNNANVENDHSAGQIVNGTARILQQIHKVLPSATVIVLSIFPRDSWRALRTVEQTNNQTMQFTDDRGIVQWFDFRQPWLKQPWSAVEQQINQAHSVDTGVPVDYELLSDGLHPSADGYALWQQQLQPLLDDVLGTRSNTDHVSYQYQRIAHAALPLQVRECNTATSIASPAEAALACV